MVHAVIVAAGEGKRAGGAIKKQFALLAGRPVIIHALTSFLESKVVDTVICVIAKEDISFFESLIKGYPALETEKTSRRLSVIEGGDSRQDSVAAGVFFLEKNFPKDDLAVIHDGARPLVRRSLIEAVVAAASSKQGAVAATPMTDSLKEVSADRQIVRSIPRDAIWAMQTPQAFLLGILADALRKAQSESFVGTDEAAIVERTGHPILCVVGDPDNIKITTALDLSRVRRIWKGSHNR